MYKLYKIVASISVVVRQCFIDNPYESLPFLTQETEIWLPLILNLATEGLFHTITFYTVKIYYCDRQYPVVGSLLYLFFYWVNTGVLTLMCKTSFALLSVCLIVVVYVIFLIALLALKNKISLEWNRSIYRH